MGRNLILAENQARNTVFFLETSRDFGPGRIICYSWTLTRYGTGMCYGAGLFKTH